MRGLLSRRLTGALVFFTLLLLLGYIARRVYFFVHIFMPHSGIALTQEEVELAHNSSTLPDPRPQHIPKLIHQIFHNWRDPANDTLPADWESVRQTCIAHNPGWDYKLWTTTSSRAFISAEYPWFLPTYDGFAYPVQRIDALRYFLMLRHGGIYIDLDNGCKAPLEPLLYYPTWVTDGGKGALSNNILASAPGHPFWRLLTDSMMSYAWHYPLPYLAVSYATGQWFETAIWEEYHRRRPEGEPPLTRIMMDMDPAAARWVFFSQERGGTWDQWDNLVFKWIGDHVVLMLLCVVAALAGIWGLGLLLLRLARRLWRIRRGYRRVGRGKPDRPDEEMELR
jgi:mannosyltransferase OCH1-like enzyme